MLESTLLPGLDAAFREGTAAGEPGWFSRLRDEAWRLAAELPPPQLERLHLNRLPLTSDIGPMPPGDGAALPAAVADRWAAAGSRPGLLFHNGRLVDRRIPAALAGTGLVVEDIAEARSRRSDVLEALYRKRQRPADRYAALHDALSRHGVFVSVPAGLELDEPIEVIHWIDAPGAMFPDVLVRMEAGARAVMVESYESPRDLAGAVVAGAVDLVVEDGARLDYGALEVLGDGVDCLLPRRGSVGRDARLHWVLGEVGARLLLGRVHTLLFGEGGESTTRAIFAGQGHEALDLSITNEHVGAHTRSDMQTRGIMDGEAHCVYNGVTIIRRGSRGSFGWQKEGTLMLSPSAHIDAIPTLTIEEFDVLGAGHAASAGQVNEEQLYYLMSRGIPRATATRLIVEGFLAPIIDAIPIAGIAGRIQAALLERGSGSWTHKP